MKKIFLVLFLQTLVFTNSFSHYNNWIYKANMQTARTFLSATVVHEKL